MEATKQELLEILGQLGIVGYTPDDSLETLYQAVRDAGPADEMIAAELAEQRGR